MNEQPVTTSRRLVHNTFFNVATLAANAIIGFFMIRFFLGRLGEVEYGVWLLIGGTIFRYAPLLSMGLSSSINRYIPVYLAKNDDDGVRRVICTSVFFFTVLAAVLICISIVIYFNVGSWFAIEPELVGTAGRLVLIVGFCFALAMPFQPSYAVLSGLQRYGAANMVALTMLLTRTALVVVLLMRGYGLLTTGIVYGLSEITGRVLQSVFARRLLPAASLSLDRIDLKLLREMLGYGINTLLYAMGAIIIYYASNLIIGIFLGTAEISQFAVATAGVLLLSQLLLSFTAAIKPAVSDLDARNDHEKVRQIATLTQKYSLLLIIPGGFFLIAMGREFLNVWVSDRFADPAVVDRMATILAILAIGHSLMLAQHSNFLVLVGRGQHRIFGALTALMGLLCISVSLVSLTLFNAGLIGVAWSNFVPMALISGLVLPLYFSRKMNLSISENVREVWQPALLGSLPAVAAITIWKCAVPPDSWLEILGVVLTAMILTFAGGWFISLKEAEQKRFAQILLHRKK